eukprot:1150320-Pelagomonas_calceolata.AAC.5
MQVQASHGEAGGRWSGAMHWPVQLQPQGGVCALFLADLHHDAPFNETSDVLACPAQATRRCVCVCASGRLTMMPLLLRSLKALVCPASATGRGVMQGFGAIDCNAWKCNYRCHATVVASS